jgi:hypothetical protein
MIGTIFWALLYASLILLLPIEFVIVTSLLWLPYLYWRTSKMGKKRGGSFLAALILVVGFGVALPNRGDQRRFGPFPSKQATLGELREAGAVFCEPGHESDLIKLPSENPTKLELLSAITNQTNLRGRIFHCASGCNLLGGAYSGRIQLRTKEASVTRTTTL